MSSYSTLLLCILLGVVVAFGVYSLSIGQIAFVVLDAGLAAFLLPYAIASAIKES